MKTRNREKGREGFTLIEVIVSTALLLVTATGFLMMTGANTGLLAKEYRLDQLNYRLSAMVEEGMGSETGETLAVSFSLEDGSGYPDVEAEEIFDQYRVSDDTEPDNSIIVYRHR